MQAALAPTTLAAAQPLAPAARAPRRLAVAASAGERPGAPALPRRAAAAALLAALPLAAARPVFADLIPDDDDEELVNKAKANRARKLASERDAEAEFRRNANYSSRGQEKELVPVQRAINGLAAVGSALEAGDVSAASSALSAAGLPGLRAAADALAFNDAARRSASALAGSLDALEGAARGGALADAKRGYVASVAALQQWAAATGVDKSVKGL
eukprot:scaffold12.g8035.t1